VNRVIKRGHDIRLAGRPDDAVIDAPLPAAVAIKPPDFRGIIARPDVEPGDAVKVGSPLFHDKQHEDVLFTSPVSGTVTAVERGARRAIQKVVVESDGRQDALSLDPPALASADRGQVLDALKRSGLLAAITQRPLAVAPDPTVTPRDIFVPAIDTAPLAADCAVLLRGSEDAFRTGLQALSRLTEGNLHLCTDGALELPEVENVDRLERHAFRGPHPAGNAGVHIHHIAPIAKRTDAVWVCPLQGVILIGRLFEEGRLVPDIVVASTGSSAPRRTHVRTVLGAPLETVTGGRADHEARYISGNPLTGSPVGPDGCLSFMDTSVTVLPEHHGYKLMGWAMPRLDTASRSRTFPSAWLPAVFAGRDGFNATTELHGGERAFIATGIYREVLPMDVYPEFLMKSILADDIPEMEGLGIYELAEEDVALCEYICPSKIRWQEILRRGLDLIQREA
jgi:Na+-transporting NADH:ubiquinone oxidoreductase subunit A